MLMKYRLWLLVLITLVTSNAYANTENIPSPIQQADIAFSKGDYKLAKIYYHKVLRTDVNNAVVLLNIAKCEVILGDIKRAIDYAVKSKKADALYTEAYLLLGRLYSHQNDWMNARIAYQAAAVLEPNNMQAQLGLGNVISWQGEKETAGKHYDRYRKLQQESEKAKPQRAQQKNTNNGNLK